MGSFYDFVAGPLFRLTFLIMILGLLRIFVLTIWGAIQAHSQAGDKTLPWKQIVENTAGWLIPIGRLWKKRPLYSITSFVFHIGLILVPIFLFEHIRLLNNSIGVSWFSISDNLADILTIVTVITAVALFIGRLASKEARFLSRPQDYFWPVLLAIPFVTGYFANNMALGAGTYHITMLVHMLSAELIFVMVPFTKVAHCVLVPLSQLVTNQGWRFPADSGTGVAKTLGKEEMPV